MATTPRSQPDSSDTLGAALLVAVGRALAVVLLVLVAVTAARGPLPGLALAAEGHAAEDHAVVIDAPDRRPGQTQKVSWRDMSWSRSAGDIASPRASVSK